MQILENTTNTFLIKLESSRISTRNTQKAWEVALVVSKFA